MASKAVVIGVGPEAGLGAALCRKFAAQGHHVLVGGRTPERIEQVANTIEQRGGRATPVQVDTTREEDVIRLFDQSMAGGDSGSADLVVYNAGNNAPHDFATMPAEFFEKVWRVVCLGGFLVGREAARRLAPLGRGTVIFTGATASLRSRPPFTAFASAKAGVRAIAESMAREFGPQGIHVAHVIIDGGINGERLRSRAPQMVAERGDDGLLDPDAIAEVYWQLHLQHRTTWSFEVDLRPFKESF
ncbi:MAG: SDR family NAD(P)-dependent oxidoreductase [Pseudomonadota bacterium]